MINIKKLLGILGTITIAGSGMAGLVGNAPNSAKSEINYSKTSNLEKLNRSKRSLSEWDYKRINYYTDNYYDVYYKKKNSSDITKIQGITGKIKQIAVAASGSAYFLTEDGYVYYLNADWIKNAERVGAHYNLPEIRNVKSITPQDQILELFTITLPMVCVLYTWWWEC